MFQKVHKSVDVSDFRAAMASHLAKAKHTPLVVSARRGGESFVVLSVEAYNKLVEAWEDEMDAKELARLVRLNKGKKLVPWERIKARYV
jgi:PHD/YefM family antitoxin component YafN of YafNO toxin-antitoxin module